jgi:uncharacterized membrane protein
MKRTVLMVFVIMTLQMAESVLAEIVYDLIPLGDIGSNVHTVYSISNNEQIVGMGWNGAAIKFDSSGGGDNTRLSSSGAICSARSINDNGLIVGYIGSSAMLFDSTGNGNNIALGTGRAYAINNNNQVVGGNGSGTDASAWLFDITGNRNNLYLGQGEAVSISDNGLIVGNSHPISGENWHATLFDPTGGGNNIDLGKLFASDDRSFSRSINDNGQIVGISGGAYTGYTATLFDISGNGNNIQLGVVGNSYAESINNSGQIVGSENNQATLFDITGSGNNINLNDQIDPSLGWTLTSAQSINDNGWIVGMGNNGAYLLTPIPEPATLALLALGGLVIRKRK